MNVLALPVAPLTPWFIACLSLVGSGIMIFLFFKQRRLPISRKSQGSPGLHEPELLHALIDNMPDWIYIKDQESRFIIANKHMASYHGIDNPADMTGQTDHDFYPKELADQFYKDEQEIMLTGQPVISKEEKLHFPNGEEVILSTTKIPMYDKGGKAVGIVGMGRNITRLKEDQQRLKELSMVASGTENVVVLLDDEGNFKWANKGFESRYGSTMEEFTRQRGENLRQNSSKGQIDEILDEILESGKPYTYTSRTQDKNGNDAWYQTNITPILNEEGKVSSIFLIDSDITAIKKADLQIKQQKYELESQRDQLKNLNNSKDRLFSIIAHDLKNPFQSIIGFSELLREDFRAMQMTQIEEYLECIHNSSTTAYDLLFNLLEWARSQTRSIQIKKVRIMVRELVSEVMELYSAQAVNKNILFRNRLDKDLYVIADRHMLNTIIRNLLANALKYTANGGIITISGSSGNGMAEINVSDTGVGMEDKKVKALFSLEKGKSTPGTSGELGTGLGLLVSYEFLKLNKGQFHVKSKLGEGSTFTITLPKSKE